MTSVTIARLFPLTTVAAGDEANAPALARRCSVRGIDVSICTVNRVEAMVDADIYLLGGTGRTGTAALVQRLQQVRLAERVGAGAVVFAVDSGMDALARTWVDETGTTMPGIGLLPILVQPGPAITDTVVTIPDPQVNLPAMIGWVSHGSHVVRAPGTAALCAIERGAQRADHGDDGALTDRVIATRLHGPVLALNPELADLVLARCLGWQPEVPVPPAAAHARSIRIAEIHAAPIPRRSLGLPTKGGWRR